MIPSVLRLLYDFLSLKNHVKEPSKTNKQKNFEKTKFFVDILKVTEENSRIRIRTRIHYSEVWIRGSGSVQKFHVSATLVLTRLYILVNQSTKTPELSIRLSFDANPDPAFEFNARIQGFDKKKMQNFKG